MAKGSVAGVAQLSPGFPPPSSLGMVQGHCQPGAGFQMDSHLCWQTLPGPALCCPLVLPVPSPPQRFLGPSIRAGLEPSPPAQNPRLCPLRTAG